MGSVCKNTPLVGKVIPELIKNLIIMPQIITNTAELSCNQGTATSNLTVTSQDFVTIEGGGDLKSMMR